MKRVDFDRLGIAYGMEGLFTQVWRSKEVRHIETHTGLIDMNVQHDSIRIVLAIFKTLCTTCETNEMSFQLQARDERKIFASTSSLKSTKRPSLNSI